MEISSLLLLAFYAKQWKININKCMEVSLLLGRNDIIIVSGQL